MKVSAVPLYVVLWVTLMVAREAVVASDAPIPAWCSRPDQFYCPRSDDCKPSYLRCDGTPQCDDEEDEENCPDTKCTAETALHLGQFFCNQSDSCIHLAWKCDGTPDCANDEDEQDCPTGKDAKCGADQFSCGDGQCIDGSWRCDSQKDCTNGADEESCEPTCAPGQTSCAPSGAQSHSASLECISAQWLCDGENDCQNGADEQGCSVHECPADRFNCSAEVKCMPRHWMCDGDNDCESGEDEADCPDEEETTVNTQLCTDLEFKCTAGTIPCIIGAWKCDDEDDCADGSDEVGCPNEELICSEAEFKCENEERCIPRFLVCSGKAECTDESDEKQPGCVPPQKHCNLTTEVACVAGIINSSCVAMEKICDGKYDCSNHFDESAELCGTDAISDPCQSSDTLCGVGPQIICTNLKTNTQSNHNRTVGHKCSCTEGYNHINKECVDRDECQDVEHPVCDQVCTNQNGSYKCDCFDGYYLSTDGRSCLVSNAIHPKLLFTNRHQIRSIHIHGQGDYMPLLDSTAAVALDFDYSTKEVFYTDMEKKKLFKFKFPAVDSEDDLKEEDLNIPGVQTPDGLAYDWVYKHLYWTDTSSNTVNMACVDDKKEARNSRVLYQNKNPNCTELSADAQGTEVCIDEPRALAVHPKKGWVFWSDWGNKPHIVLAALDGSHMEMIAYNSDSSKQYVYWPNGLTLDLSSDTERLYWIDAQLHSIFSCNINNCVTDINVLVYNTQNIDHPFSITVFENKLYWSDWSHKHIVSANKFTGGNITQILDNLEQPMDLKVFHPMSQQPSTNHCETPDGGQPFCQQICVPKPWSRAAVTDVFSPVPEDSVKHTCLCSEGYQLAADGSTCSLIVTTTTAPPATSGQTGASDMSVGTVAIIATASITFIFSTVVVVVFLFWRRYKASKPKDMNFDNPIYKRTTEDKLELPRHEYQPSHSDPAANVPLTASEATSSSQDDFDV